MNWIVEGFEKLKARFESHVKNSNASLTELSARVDGAEKLVQSAVASVELRAASQATALQEVTNRLHALELKTGSTPQ